jgi:hypothetical protein
LSAALPNKNFGTFNPFNFLDFDVFNCRSPFPENSAPYESGRLARSLH